MICGKFFARFVLAAVIFFTINLSADAQSFADIPSASHAGKVTCLVQDENGNIFSAGEDGFINFWNMQKNAAEDRFQLSPYAIVSMVHRPGRSHIAIVESDGMGLYRISAWDYLQKKKLFTLRFKDPVSYITYSRNGSFLIAARNGRTGIVFLNPENGELLQAPSALNSLVTFSATGKSERTMIVYSPLGVLSYWNLETGEEIQAASVPQNIRSPILFNNNLFFAGIDNNGLVILDALSGREIRRNTSIKDGELLVVSEEGRDFICIQKQNESIRYILFRIDNAGNLRVVNQRNIPNTVLRITSSMLLENRVVLGTEDGKVHLYNERNNRIQEMQTVDQADLHEIAASGDSLVLLHHSAGIAFIPADFHSISADTVIHFEDAGGFNQIDVSDTAYNSESFFVLWNYGDVNSVPVIRDTRGIIAEVEGLSRRYPLLSVSVLNKLVLFLDTGGNISIFNADTKTIEYRHNASGSLHASFIDEQNIIAARNANTGNAPFLMLNTATEETVPLAYPADIGTRVYRSQNGTLYGAVVNQHADESITRIISIDTSNPSNSQNLVEYFGEDTAFSVAECGGNLATTLGGGGATLYTQWNFGPFERSSGLPQKLINTERYFAVLDSSGSIIWHNPFTGGIEATLRLYGGKWYLQKKSGEVLEGIIQ